MVFREQFRMCILGVFNYVEHCTVVDLIHGRLIWGCENCMKGAGTGKGKRKRERQRERKRKGKEKEKENHGLGTKIGLKF